MANQTDILVIGAGPGGYVAAIRAAQLGQKVTIVEKAEMGGICLNWGCIPTKALLRSAEVHHNISHGKDFGFENMSPKVHWDKVIERSRGVSGQLSSGIQHLMKKNKIQVLTGEGKLTKRTPSGFEVTVGKEKVLAKKVILATGARARALPGYDFKDDNVWNYRKAMVAEACPKKLLVIGSGAIGVEFASFYNQMGTEVTIVELQDRILPVEDHEVSDLARKAFEKQGIRILTKTTAALKKSTKSGVTLTLEDQAKKSSKDETFDKVLVAVGIQANTENLGLEALSVKQDRGHVVVDGYCQTNVPGLYAIGDMAGAPWLAHKASHEGVIAAEHAAGQKDVHPMKKENIPGCTYSHPQVASVGLTEQAAKDQGLKIKVGRFPGVGNGKAIAYGDPSGMVKVIFEEKTGELLGAHMIGPEVTEQIQGFVVAKTLEATEADLMHTVFPHPTLSEMMHEAVLGAWGRSIHI